MWRAQYIQHQGPEVELWTLKHQLVTPYSSNVIVTLSLEHYVVFICFLYQFIDSCSDGSIWSSWYLIQARRTLLYQIKLSLLQQGKLSNHCFLQNVPTDFSAAISIWSLPNIVEKLIFSIIWQRPLFLFQHNSYVWGLSWVEIGYCSSWGMQRGEPGLEVTVFAFDFWLQLCSCGIWIE